MMKVTFAKDKGGGASARSGLGSDICMLLVILKMERTGAGRDMSCGADSRAVS